MPPQIFMYLKRWTVLWGLFSLLIACIPITLVQTESVSQVQQPIPTGSTCLDSEGVVTIKVHDWSSPDRQKYWDEVIQKFSSAYPCIQVESIRLPEDRVVRVEELSQGTAPDLVGFDSTDLPLVALKGYLLDLSPIMAKDQFNPDEHFFESVYQTGFVNGKPMAIAKDYSVSAFYVNTDLLAKAGIAVPQEGWTYGDYLEMALKLTMDGAGNNATSPLFNPKDVVVWGTILGQWGSDTGWWRGFQSFLYSWGAHTISPDGKTTTGYLNSDQAVAAWTWYKDLIHKYHVAPTVSFLSGSGANNDNFFREQKISISGVFWGPWYQDTFNQTAGLKWAAVPLPTGPGGHHAAIMWMGWGINSKSKHPEEAWQLLKWLTTEPGQKVFALKALTGDKTVAEAMHLEEDPFWSIFLAEVAYQDNLDDMTTPFYTTCVDIPAGRLAGKMYQEASSRMNIKSELNKLAAFADQCLANSSIQK